MDSPPAAAIVRILQPSSSLTYDRSGRPPRQPRLQHQDQRSRRRSGRTYRVTANNFLIGGGDRFSDFHGGHRAVGRAGGPGRVHRVPHRDSRTSRRRPPTGSPWCHERSIRSARVPADPHTPWRRRIGTAPKSWVLVMAAAVFLGWLPFAGRSLSPDEAGYLLVGRQWSGQQPVRRLLGRPATGADRDLRGRRRARQHGAAAADRRAGRGAHRDAGRRPRPDRGARAPVGSPAHRGHGGGVRRDAAVRRHRRQRRAARAAVPGRRDPRVRRGRGQPAPGRGFLLSVAAGAAGAIGALVKQSLVDVFVVAAVLLFTSGAARGSSPGCWPAPWARSPSWSPWPGPRHRARRPLGRGGRLPHRRRA